MIEILPAADHVIAMKVTGCATSNDYDRIIAAIDAKLDAHDRIGIYVDLEGFEDITAHAIAKDLKYSLGKLGELSRFPRVAVVTPKDWLRTLIRMTNPVLPRIEMRAFDTTEREQALPWVSEVGIRATPAV
ncbi:STAS/SEC14 domain-containing protein [Coralloluteibacterium thermophilus]|uniref:STAS/SEC14 domain-containing protein n=1 Tax=Coralloluteibacterium thermophilum TaxID=2707049 RepID=A0ABV9NQ11_9GAMM